MLSMFFPWPHRKIIERPATDVDKVETLSVIHPLRSLRQLLRENSSPKRLAVAAGVGVLLGTLPLLFLHTIAILFVCGFFRLNKVAAVSSRTEVSTIANVRLIDSLLAAHPDRELVEAFHVQN